MQTHENETAVPLVSRNQNTAVGNNNQHRVHDTHAVEAQDSFFVYMISHLRKSQNDQAVRDDTPIDGAILDIPYQIGLMLHEISMVNVEHAAGFMVIDTACQRNCHGISLRIAHEQILTKSGLSSKLVPENENFQFGAGDAQVSRRRHIFPSAMQQISLILGS